MDPTRGWPELPSRFDSDPLNPGNSSTIATSGTNDHRTFDVSISPAPSGHDPRRATVGGELESLPEQLPAPEEPLFEVPNTRHPTQSPSHPSELGSTLPTGVIPTHIETYSTTPIDPVVNTTPQPRIELHQQTSPPTRPTPIPIQQPPPQVIRNVAPPPPPPPPVAPAPPPQLTPKQIAQAQKHCRYAISALDYEDFERARQDLLDALKIIGG